MFNQLDANQITALNFELATSRATTIRVQAMNPNVQIGISYPFLGSPSLTAVCSNLPLPSLRARFSRLRSSDRER